MPVFHWGRTWDPFRDLERQVDEILQSIQLPFPVIRVERQYPPINIYDLPEEALVTAEVPGTDPEALEVTFSQGVLTLKGTQPSAESVRDDAFRRHERFWGRWQRSISINERVREDQVRAEMVDGVLRVHLPKDGESRPRQIPVTVSDT